jgi:hypothetical protein
MLSLVLYHDRAAAGNPGRSYDPIEVEITGVALSSAFFAGNMLNAMYRETSSNIV